MNDSILNDQLFISEDVKNVAVLGIPKFLLSNDSKDLKELSLSIANAFGRGDFSIFLEQSQVEAEKKLIESFVKNVQLLVQKTWVEKADEELKEETLYRINKLCDVLIANETDNRYELAFVECFSILYDVVALLFGELVKTDNFLDYAFRVDPAFGFFWYFVERISKIEKPKEEKARLCILLAMFFLANF